MTRIKVIASILLFVAFCLTNATAQDNPFGQVQTDRFLGRFKSDKVEMDIGKSGKTLSGTIEMEDTVHKFTGKVSGSVLKGTLKDKGVDEPFKATYKDGKLKFEAICQ